MGFPVVDTGFAAVDVEAAVKVRVGFRKGKESGRVGERLWEKGACREESGAKSCAEERGRAVRVSAAIVEPRGRLEGMFLGIWSGKVDSAVG